MEQYGTIWHGMNQDGTRWNKMEQDRKDRTWYSLYLKLAKEDKLIYKKNSLDQICLCCIARGLSAQKLNVSPTYLPTVAQI